VSHADADTNGYAYRDSDSNTYSHSNSYNHTYRHANGNTNADTNCDGYRYSQGYAAAAADAAATSDAVKRMVIGESALQPGSLTPVLIRDLVTEPPRSTTRGYSSCPTGNSLGLVR
jgi:hypothetical protein